MTAASCFDSFFGPPLNTKNWWENSAKSSKIKWSWEVYYHFWTKCATLSWNFLQNISNITQIRKGGKFKSRLVLYRYLLTLGTLPWTLHPRVEWKLARAIFFSPLLNKWSFRPNFKICKLWLSENVHEYI